MEAKERGNKAFQSGDWQTAAKWYTAALEADPQMAVAYANRAACEINLHEWAQGLADCNAALALEMPKSLRVKALWRKAVCLRHLGSSEPEWTAAVHEGLALDSSNDKLKDEQQHIFVKRVATTPREYTRSSEPVHNKPSVAASAAAPAASAAPPRSTPLFAPPPRPLSYAGVLKLTRSKSEPVYEFWYNEVSGAELINAHRSAGIEPDTLDYLHEMIALHPQHTEKNRELMQALAQCARYSSASVLADERLYKQALAAVGP